MVLIVNILYLPENFVDLFSNYLEYNFPFCIEREKKPDPIVSHVKRKLSHVHVSEEKFINFLKIRFLNVI